MKKYKIVVIDNDDIERVTEFETIAEYQCSFNSIVLSDYSLNRIENLEINESFQIDECDISNGKDIFQSVDSHFF